jgi:allantoinase
VSASELVVHAERLMTPSGERAASMVVTDGHIVAITALDRQISAARVSSYGVDVVVLPGAVDTHVHLQDPGRPTWETAECGTLAAARGGVTTVVDMPLDSDPVTVSVPALQRKRAALAGRSYVDIGFWAGATPDNLDAMPELFDAGVLGFKGFLCPTGLAEFPPLDAPALAKALSIVTALDSVLLVHAEDGDLLPANDGLLGTRYTDYLATRPAAMEITAAATAIALAGQTGARVHIVHVSAAEIVELARVARSKGVLVSLETCPHYLVLSAETIPDGSTPHKAMPPVREAANAERLWDALASGALGMVVSDHSPCSPDGKPVPGDFGVACGGISSLEHALPVLWTEAVRRGHGLAEISQWVSAAPAALAGLTDKGALVAGKAADFVIFDPSAEQVVDVHRLAQRQPVTPYAGQRLTGVVRETWLAGQLVEEGQPAGTQLLGSRAKNSWKAQDG